MIRWLLPQRGESFGGWLFRLFLIIITIFGLMWLYGTMLMKLDQDEDPPQKEWTGYDPTRPVSDISYRDYKTKTVYYPPKGNYSGPPLFQENNSPSKYTDEYLEEIFLDNDLANDYEDLYEKYRD